MTGKQMRLFLAIIGLALLAPLAALADCASLTGITVKDLGTTSIATVQHGLRAALQDSDRRLNDRTLGEYTKRRLSDLCRDVPRLDGEDDLLSTLELTREYASLDTKLKTWANTLFSPKFGLLLLQEAGLKQATLALRLAGKSSMTVQALGDPITQFYCDGADTAIANSPDAEAGMHALQVLYGKVDATDICKMLPVTGSGEDFILAIARLGQLEASLTGALRDLQDPRFSGWLGSKPDQKLLRLAGSPSAVLRLITDFRTETQFTPQADVYTSGPCAPKDTETTLTYYELSKADVEAEYSFINLTPVFEAFRAANPQFDSPQALWAELRPTLQTKLPDCILSAVESLVTGKELALEFELDPARKPALDGEVGLQTAKPVLEEFLPARTATREELLASIRDRLTSIRAKAAKDEVTAAVDTFAASAEPVEPMFDVAPEGVEIPPPPETIPRIAVTDATDAALAATVENPKIAEILARTPFLPVTNPELIKATARAALREATNLQTAIDVDDQMKLIAPAIKGNWRLTPALQQAILDIPYIAHAIADPTAANLPERLKTLAGIAYPSRRLLEVALSKVKSVSGNPAEEPFSPYVKDRLILTAQKTANGQIDRVYGPLQTPGCGCVAKHIYDSEVYGFYPFWNAPPKLPGQPVAANPDDTADVPAVARQKPEEVNFEIFSRIAFYGLEFNVVPPKNEGDAQQVMLSHEAQWTAGRREFVNSAHQHRVKADLALDLWHWKSWTAKNISDVADKISTLLTPFPKFERNDTGGRMYGPALPTLFDRPQPDGVTLIFNNYTGEKLDGEQVQTLIQIIESVYAALPDRQRIDINVAFEFDNVAEHLKMGIFDELYELLVDKEVVVRAGTTPDPNASATSVEPAVTRETAKIINYILLFLERPTTEAKKGLRYRMEQGLFQGTKRAAVLNSIIPVVPGSGHRLVHTRLRANAVPGTEPKDFSQLEDDIVYFRDSFAGIGFWPVPKQFDPADPAKGGDETNEIEKLFIDQLNDTSLPLVLAAFPGPVKAVCTWACPNRAYIALSAMVLFASIIALTWRSFYSGLVDRLAFRTFMIGLVWLGNLLLIGILSVLTACDPNADWPPRLLIGLVILLGLTLTYNFYQRVLNGPKP